ncbi:FadR/GntR family transcriptional regulator [Novosphingobium sp. BL-52-GroH]|uniref:FadR/GntR family transcriptional regulator n=1 Tax=Novosphingobium sp. BL-52-GroH TaxID=3349877 RepID=UPI00384FDBBC
MTANASKKDSDSAPVPTEIWPSTHLHIARAIGMDILSGSIGEGELLPSEATLLARFGVSRTVLREVLKTLTAKGLVVSKTRVGTKVLPSAHWSYFDADVLSWKLAVGYDAKFRDDLAEIRRAIEPHAAALAARRRTAEDITALREAIAAMRAPGHTAKSFAVADLALHRAVGAASGNPLMRSIATIIEAALNASFTLNSAVEEPDVLNASLDQHEAIVDAIEAGDVEAAAAAMLWVIDLGTARITAAVTKNA